MNIHKTSLISLIYLFCTIYLIGSAESAKLAKLKKSDCIKDNFPKKSEDLSQVVLHGIVDQVYMTDNGSDYKAFVNVTRVIKGSDYLNLEGGTILVTGFNQSTTESHECLSNVRPKDTMIYLLDHKEGKTFTLNATVIPMNINNLDRINALALNQPYKKRLIIETPCETQYCPFNGDCIERDNQPKCICPTSCESTTTTSEVCGSNNKTYSNECTLRVESCLHKEEVYVRKLGKC